MITAVDTSIVLDVIVDDPTWKDRSIALLNQARAEGQLIISEIALAEITPALGTGPDTVHDLLNDWQLDFVPCSVEAAAHAGNCFTQYLQRGGKRGRIVADFLIAAHAQHHADRLLARDDGFKRDYFKELELLSP
ncbi:MAG: type II toxin-antitoxin system VapC family toxin [Verrucomicrobiota bacterium]